MSWKNWNLKGLLIYAFFMNEKYTPVLLKPLFCFVFFNYLIVVTTVI